MELEIIQEEEISDNPLITFGGYKDSKKNGALRLCDSVTLLEDGRYRVVKTWQIGQFSDELYETR